MLRRTFIKLVSGTIGALLAPQVFAILPEVKLKTSEVRTFISPASGADKFTIDVIYNKHDYHNYATSRGHSIYARWSTETKVDMNRAYDREDYDDEFEFEQADIMYDQIRIIRDRDFFEEYLNGK